MKRSNFMKAIFPPDLMEEDEKPLVSHPASFTDQDGFHRSYYSQMYWMPRMAGFDTREEGWLYCVSTVKVKEKARRRAEDIVSAWVVPCDDVGTKAKKPPVPPSYIVETSPENFQYGYIIQPFDVSSGSGGFEYYDGVLLGLIAAGYNDKGCRSATRVIKLPGAIHKSGFVTRLVEWHPERVWDIEDLVSDMGIEVAEVPERNARELGSTDVEDIDDPIYEWLHGRGLTFGSGGSGFINVKCPWHYRHSDPKESLAGYSPKGYGMAGRSFHCFHGHCQGRNVADLISWVSAEGGPGLLNNLEN